MHRRFHRPSAPAAPALVGAERLALREAATTILRSRLARKGSGHRAHDLLEWLRDNAAPLGLPETERPDHESATRADEREAFRDALARLEGGGRNGAVRPSARPSALERRVGWIADTVGLSALDHDLLLAIARACLYEPFGTLLAAAIEHGWCEGEVHVDALWRAMGRSRRQVAERLQRHRPLRQLGLIEDRRSDDVGLSHTVRRLVGLRSAEPDRLRAALFGPAPRATLDWDDFAHLGDARDLARDLVAAALEDRPGRRGVGVLIHGVPGTGKTEFAKALARQVGARAVFVGEGDRDGDEPTREDRIAHLALSAPLAGRAGRTVLIVDEADDLFAGVDADMGGGGRRRGSKVFMNRVVENCPAPTVWITNHPDRLGEAVLRRMALAVEFRTPGRLVRRRIAERASAKRRVRLDDAGLDRLAALPAAPALIDAGLRAAQLAGGGADTALRAATSLVEATGRTLPPPSQRGAAPFDPALSSADTDLARLTERAVAAHARGVGGLSFLLSGLPGTGKSAFARHLAERMGIETIERRASDLLGMYVGENEKLIRDAFRESADAGAMLVIDEADSLLANRAGAHRNWEVSQVNEMLTWMERHPAPFAMTTNAVDALDPAALRRFVHKVRFEAMSAEQIATLFARAFGCDAPPAALHLDPLTPGDFATVARRAEVLGVTDPRELTAMLADEVAAKPGAGRGRIGFTG